MVAPSTVAAACQQGEVHLVLQYAGVLSFQASFSSLLCGYMLEVLPIFKVQGQPIGREPCQEEHRLKREKDLDIRVHLCRC
jgi:hypothetical protein